MIAVMFWYIAACRPEPAYSVLLEGVPGGTGLGAWDDGAQLWVVGGQLDGSAGSLSTYDGARWCVEEEVAERPLWWIHGAGPGRWTAVGEAGTVLHGQDGARTRDDVPTALTLFGVWTGADGTQRVVGGDVDAQTGELWRRDPAGWTLEASTPGPAFKIWERWVVGEGFAWHLEDGAWVDRSPPDSPKLLTVRGRADDAVWAVGGQQQALLLAWDGAAWAEVDIDPFCASQPLAGVYTAPGEPLWITGMSGAMGLLDEEGWVCPELPVGYDSFHAVWPFGEEVLAIGGNLFERGGNTTTVGRYGPERGPVALSCL